MTHRMIFFPILLFSTIVFAQNDNSKLKEKAAAAADKIESKCIEWRRDFHQHPELGNSETRTAAIIAAHLKKLGIETKEGVGKTGVVGILKGGKPGPCIALRADMDGLPIVERVNLPFTSKVNPCLLSSSLIGTVNSLMNRVLSRLVCVSLLVISW